MADKDESVSVIEKLDFRFLPQNNKLVAKAEEITRGWFINYRFMFDVLHRQFIKKKLNSKNPVPYAIKKIVEDKNAIGVKTTYKHLKTYDTPWGKCYTTTDYQIRTERNEPFDMNKPYVTGIKQAISGQDPKKEYKGSLNIWNHLKWVAIQFKPIYGRLDEFNKALQPLNYDMNDLSDTIEQNIADFKANIQEPTNDTYFFYFEAFENKEYYQYDEVANENENFYVSAVFVRYASLSGREGEFEVTEEFIEYGTLSDYIKKHGSYTGKLGSYIQKKLPGDKYNIVQMHYTDANGNNYATKAEVIEANAIITKISLIKKGEKNLVKIEENFFVEVDTSKMSQREKNAYEFVKQMAEKYKTNFACKNIEDVKQLIGEPLDLSKKLLPAWDEGPTFTSKGFVIYEGFSQVQHVDNPQADHPRYYYTWQGTNRWYAVPLFYYDTDQPVCRNFYWIKNWNNFYTINYEAKGGSKIGKIVGFVIMAIGMVLAAWTGGTSAAATQGATTALSTAASYLGAITMVATGMAIQSGNKEIKKIADVLGVVAIVTGIAAALQNIGKVAAQESAKQVAVEGSKEFAKDMAQKTSMSLFERIANSTAAKVLGIASKLYSGINSILSLVKGGDVPEYGEDGNKKEPNDDDKREAAAYEIDEDGKKKLKFYTKKYLREDRLDLYTADKGYI